MGTAVVKKKHAGLFQPGNKLAVGHRGPDKLGPSQILLSLLNEIDNETNRGKMYKLCDKLYDLAVGYKIKKKIMLDGQVVGVEEVEVPPDITAIKEVFDRVEGKARQAVEVTGADKGPVQFEDVTAAREKLGKLLEMKVVNPEPGPDNEK